MRRLKCVNFFAYMSFFRNESNQHLHSHITKSNYFLLLFSVAYFDHLISTFANNAFQCIKHVLKLHQLKRKYHGKNVMQVTMLDGIAHLGYI